MPQMSFTLAAHILIAVIACEAAVEILVSSALFQPMRERMLKRRVLGQLAACPYCVSVWAAGAVVWLLDIATTFGMLILWTLVVHRLSNLLHALVHGRLIRFPFCINVHLTREQDDGGA